MVRNAYSSLKLTLSRYRSNVRGAVGVAVALMGALFLGFAILAVDVGTTEFRRQHLQRALDTALLSAGTTTSEIKTDKDRANLEAAVKNHMVKTLPANLGEVVVAVNAVSDETTGETAITASATIPNPWLSAPLLGGDFDSVLTVSNGITRPDGKKLEVALVLDNTWSMSTNSRMPDLKNASTLLVNTLMTEDAPVKIAVIPYTEYVNVGLSNRFEPWLSVEPNSSTTTFVEKCNTPCLQSVSSVEMVNQCTGGCSGGQCTDGICTPVVCTPKVCNLVPRTVSTCVLWGDRICSMQPVTTTRTWSGCVGSRPSPLNVSDAPAAGPNTYPGLMNETRCPAPLTPLTTNKATVTAAINAMAPLNPHNTYVPAGLVWGFAALTDSAPLTQAEPSANGAVMKALILMTDGDNTRSMTIHSQNPGKWGHQGPKSPSANTATSQLCANVKAEDITVYTVALAVTDPPTLSMLTACASGPDKAFTASNGAQLSEAFKSIADSLREIALVQ